VADPYVKENSLTALYDSVLIPVITAAQTDHQRGAMDTEQRDSVEQGIRDVVEAPNIWIPTPAGASIACRRKLNAWARWGDAHAIPSAAGLRGATHPAKLVVGELVKLVDEADVDAARIFVVAPSTVIHARYLCVKLRAQLPNLKIAIGLWGANRKTSFRRPNVGAMKWLGPGMSTPVVESPFARNVYITC
jgi:hypothetical protein